MGSSESRAEKQKAGCFSKSSANYFDKTTGKGIVQDPAHNPDYHDAQRCVYGGRQDLQTVHNARSYAEQNGMDLDFEELLQLAECAARGVYDLSAAEWMKIMGAMAYVAKPFEQGVGRMIG